MYQLPITGGQNLGRSSEETDAVDGGALIVTFFFDLTDASPSLLRFFVLSDAIPVSQSCVNFSVAGSSNSSGLRWDGVVLPKFF